MANHFSILAWEPLEQYGNAIRYDRERWTPLVGRCPICYWRRMEKNKEKETKWKQHPIVNVAGDGSKVWCCKEQYCIGTWNVRSMKKGKLEVVKLEMARVNIHILGIRELKWTQMGEFNSEDHYIYYCGQESLRRNGVAIIGNKSLKCSTWVQSQKWQNDFCSFPRQIIQHHSNPGLCSNH